LVVEGVVQDGVELQADLRDSFAAFGEVGVEDVLGLEADEVEDGLYGVVGIDNPPPAPGAVGVDVFSVSV
jgi:hypothetical protein